MAYIHIDIDEYIDEVDTDVLVNEIKYRAKRQNVPVHSLIRSSTTSGTIKEEVCDLLGLNHLASKDDIIEAIQHKIR